MRVGWLILIVGLSGCTTFWTGAIEATPAPPIVGHDVTGTPYEMPSNGTVLIDFMGTWCGPCQRAVPVLRDLQEAYPDLTVVSISGTDTEEKVQDFQAQHGANWTHLVAPDIVDAYREAGSSSPTMMWPSYALVVDGQLVFYNRGETLPATFTHAIDAHTTREAPAISAATTGPALAALALGALAWFTPWMREHHVDRPPRGATRWVPLGMFVALGFMAGWANRPLTGRVATVAPFVAAGAVVAIVWWRWRGVSSIDYKPGWRGALSRHTNLLWYTIPAWAAVLHASMLRTAPWESWLMVSLFGVGLMVADLAARRWQTTLARVETGWLGAGAFLLGAAWNAMLYLR